MKYRIVERKFSDGEITFFIQKRILGMWFCETRPGQCDYYRHVCFNTQQEAEKWLEVRTKKPATLLAERIVQ